MSHRTAPVELRERVDFARAGLEAALAGLAARNVVREMAVLSTCNRAEVYAAADSDDAGTGWRVSSASITASPTDLQSHLYIHRGAERRGICSASPPASTLSSSASRRSSAR